MCPIDAQEPRSQARTQNEQITYEKRSNYVFTERSDRRHDESMHGRTHHLAPENDVEPAIETLGDLLEHRAASNPKRASFVWYDESEHESSLTYAELYERASAIAARLNDGQCGARTLLLCPPGLEFIKAFFGCILAGSVAVPAYAPDPRRLQRSLARLLGIVRDCEIDQVLTVESMIPMIRSVVGTLPEFDDVRLLATDLDDTSNEGVWRRPSSRASDVAVVQYTSGSTSRPKGVVLDHGNILANAAAIRRVCRLGPDRCMALWLPPYHDMGLFGGIVQPLYADMPVHLMSPLDFIRDPRRWLSMITRSRATISGGPNFAYDRAVRKISHEHDHELDLSSWQVAFSGSEPVRGASLKAFAERFSDCGFNTKALFPVYGLAEATLMVTAPELGQAPRIEKVDGSSLREKGRAVRAGNAQGGYPVVSCGRVIDDHELEIVDPETRCRRGESEVGEIWVKGPSVSRGYLGKPDESRDRFAATLEDGNGPFLRTGDLGFRVDGDLFITGRAKELIIVRGRNFHPHDIERIAEGAATVLRQGCSAAFQSQDDSGQGGAVTLVLETTSSSDDANVQQVLFDVRRTVQGALDLQLDVVVLAEPGSVPKTSSGKVQRALCAKTLTAGDIKEVGRWVSPETRALVVPPSRPPCPSAQEVQSWLFEKIGALSGVPVDSVTPDADFALLGLDSVTVTDLISELDVWIGREIPQSFLAESNIGSFATLVAGFAAEERAEHPPDAPLEQRDEPARPRANGTRLRAPRRSLIPHVNRWSGRNTWEHSSPLAFLNAPGRDLFARTDAYSDFCQGMQRDQLYSFELARIDEREGGQVLIETRDRERRWAVDLSSHDYLGLTRHPKVIEATRLAIEEFGVGASGATLLNGNTPVHRALEAELAEWLGKEAVALCPSGFSMMSGVTSGLLRPSDIVFFDEYSHASLLDGIRLSGARSIRFPHNNVDALQKLMARYRSECRGAMIVTDGVCSIDGSCALVGELATLARTYEARLVVDDAHGIGTIGDGRGTTVGHTVDLVGGVLSKALGACGGFVAGERRVVDYIRFFGRSACATTNVSVANAAAALASLRLIRSEPDRVTQLQQKVQDFRVTLRKEGIQVSDTPAPIVAIVVGRDADAYRLWREALDLGVLAQALPFPIVPREQARIRARISHKLDPELLHDAAIALSEAAKLPRSHIVLSPPKPPAAAPTDLESRTLPNGVRVHIRRGPGPWRVFLHPLLLSSEEAYSEVLARYGTDRGIVAVDWWGHGDAGRAPIENLTLGQMADDLIDVLEEIEVPSPCRLIGTSMGAMVALRVAAAHPQWTASLLLMGGSAEPEEGPARHFYGSLLDVAAELGTESIVDDVLTSQLSSWFRGEHPERTKLLLEALGRVDPQHVAPCIRAVLNRPGALEEARRVQAPTVVLVGEADLAEPVGHSERLAELVRGATLEVLPRCGHLVPVERPDAVLEVLRRWDAEDASVHSARGRSRAPVLSLAPA